ncbi:MAG TPA: DegT/DnrJ/EryC1/StrS family aminotransferase, partial [Methylophilaceae bacterium]|nr:DegT/DnrJ/EryC1/StrS family aminotransferase [Methylophilaceae bacterium]
MINVTQTYLPPLEEYVEQLKKIWTSGQVTNNGPLVKELELSLKEYLGVKHLFLTANGTIALQIALRAAGVSKKVITTPFSYVATTGALLWEHCTPKFTDINAQDYCIDPELIE